MADSKGSHRQHIEEMQASVGSAGPTMVESQRGMVLGAWSPPEPNLQSAWLQERKFGLEETRFLKENNINLYFQFSLSRKKVSSWEDFDPMDVSPLPMYGWSFMGR